MGNGWRGAGVRRRDQGRPLTPGYPPCHHYSRPLLKLFPLPRPSSALTLPGPVHQGWLKCRLLQEPALTPFAILPPACSDHLLISVSTERWPTTGVWTGASG